MVDFPLFLYEIADVHLKTKNLFHLCILLPVSFPVPSAFFLIPFQHRSYFLYFHTAILAYTEFYFTDVPWPAFDKNELKKAIDAYNKRDRRFGGLKETNDTEDK